MAHERDTAIVPAAAQPVQHRRRKPVSAQLVEDLHVVELEQRRQQLGGLHRAQRRAGVDDVDLLAQLLQAVI